MILELLSELPSPTELGKELGTKHKGKLLSNPYPPYPLGTKKANEWLHAYRIARYDEDWQEHNQEAIEVFKKVVEK